MAKKRKPKGLALNDRKARCPCCGGPRGLRQQTVLVGDGGVRASGGRMTVCGICAKLTAAQRADFMRELHRIERGLVRAERNGVVVSYESARGYFR